MDSGNRPTTESATIELPATTESADTHYNSATQKFTPEKKRHSHTTSKKSHRNSHRSPPKNHRKVRRQPQSKNPHRRLDTDQEKKRYAHDDSQTFFIAALLAMQYEKGLVLLGSMGALSLMTILSVVIGRIFHSVPAQFQTTLPIGEYAAVTLLMFFGLKSIKDAWDLPTNDVKIGDESSLELDEYTEAEKLVKVSKLLTNPFEIVWKSFSLVFFAEWGDRSMLATIALGAAQSPWGVATGAIAGHLVATSIAILGGAFLANYISEKLVGYLGGVLFLVFAVATFFGFF